MFSTQAIQRANTNATSHLPLNRCKREILTSECENPYTARGVTIKVHTVSRQIDLIVFITAV